MNKIYNVFQLVFGRKAGQILDVPPKELQRWQQWDDDGCGDEEEEEGGGGRRAVSQESLGTLPLDLLELLGWLYPSVPD